MRKQQRVTSVNLQYLFIYLYMNNKFIVYDVSEC